VQKKIKVQYHKFIKRGVSKNKRGKEGAGMLIQKSLKENVAVQNSKETQKFTLIGV
jgi:Zn-dependent membrane protease YugP